MVLDYRKDDLLQSLPHRPDVVKPNWAEFVETFFPGQVCALARALCRQSACRSRPPPPSAPLFSDRPSRERATGAAGTRIPHRRPLTRSYPPADAG